MKTFWKYSKSPPEKHKKKDQPVGSSESSPKPLKKTQGKTPKKEYLNGDNIYASIRNIGPVRKLQWLLKKNGVCFMMFCVFQIYCVNDIIDQVVKQVTKRSTCKPKDPEIYKKCLKFIVGKSPDPIKKKCQ